jgi:hypothetical protein
MASLVSLVAAGAVGACTLDTGNLTSGAEAFSVEAGEFTRRLGGLGLRRRRSTWGSEAAAEGLAFLEVFVTFDSDPPAPVYVDGFPGKPDAIGQWDGTDIKIKRGLPPDQERWVAIHEIFHWAQFGGPVLARARSAWDAEIGGSTRHPAIYDYHWSPATLTGRHRTSGLSAQVETMAPTVGSAAFLSSATLVQIDKVVAERWCVDDGDCPGSACTLYHSQFPRLCGGAADLPPDAPRPRKDPVGLSAEELGGIVAGSVGGVAILAYIVIECRDRCGGARGIEQATLLGARLN